MIQFGMPSLVEARTVEQCAQVCAELGLSFIELNANFPQFQPVRLQAEELNGIAQKYGIGYTLHLDDDLSIADFNDYVCDAYCRTVRETIELAKKANIRVLNMHLSKGAVYTLPHRKLYFFGEYLDTYISRIRTFRDSCEALIGDSDVRISVENCDGWLDFHRAAIDVLLESPVFQLTLDAGHDFCAGGMDRSVFDVNSQRLKHMHLHDARAPKQDHQPLGQGEMDIPALLTLAEKNSCTVVLETKTEEGLRQSVRWLKEKGQLNG